MKKKWKTTATQVSAVGPFTVKIRGNIWSLYWAETGALLREEECDFPDISWMYNDVNDAIETYVNEMLQWVKSK